jgi:hypothetical protein
MRYMKGRRFGAVVKVRVPGKFAGATDIAVGGGSAMLAAAVARGLAPAGTFWARRTGTIAAISGSLVALASREKLSGVLAALIVGGAIELVQAVTDYRVSHPRSV